MSKKGGSGCGCASGGMLGGSGYSFNLSSQPMLIGKTSGYGAIDPYAPGITTGSGFRSSLAYPPLEKMAGGNSRSRSRSQSRSSRFRRSKSRRVNVKRSRSEKSKKTLKRVSGSKNRSRRNKKRLNYFRGGDLAFSDYSASPSPSAPLQAQMIGQTSSSPTYGVNLSPLSPKMSALANPVIPERKENCGK